jgi:hypothetical protein
MMSTQHAPGLAHGIGASAVPRVDHKGLPVKEEPRLKKTRRPTTGPRPVTRPRPSAPLVAAMEDDVPVVTEWRANGLPQRRRKYDTKVIEDQIIVTPRNPDLSTPPPAAEPAPAAYGTHAPGAAPPGQPDRHDGAEQPEPGLWVEAFMNGLKPEGGQAEAADAVGQTAQDPEGSAKPHDDAYNQQVDEGDHQ